MDDFVILNIEDFYSPIDYYEFVSIIEHKKKLYHYLKNHWKRQKHDILLQTYSLLPTMKEKAFRVIHWIAIFHPYTFKKKLSLFLKYTDNWQLFFNILFHIPEKSRCFLLYFIKKQFEKDMKNYDCGLKYSSLVKCFPRENSALDKKTGIVKILCEELGLSRRKYRKYVVGMKQSL